MLGASADFPRGENSLGDKHQIPDCDHLGRRWGGAVPCASQGAFCLFEIIFFLKPDSGDVGPCSMIPYTFCTPEVSS